MANRFKIAFSALLVILVITLGCLAFVPWRMIEVIPQLEQVEKGMVLRYENGKYATAYPKDEELEVLLSAVGDATGYFDRKRPDIAPSAEAPLYRIYFWDAYGRLPEIWVCGTELFYENTQYVLTEESTQGVGGALQTVFGKG